MKEMFYGHFEQETCHAKLHGYATDLPSPWALQLFWYEISPPLFTSAPIKNSTPLTSPSGLAAITFARENIPFLGNPLVPTFFGELPVLKGMDIPLAFSYIVE